MITARYYEDMMLDLEKKFEENPESVKKQMDELNIETLVCLGYSAGARVYARSTGTKLKEAGEKREYNG